MTPGPKGKERRCHREHGHAGDLSASSSASVVTSGRRTGQLAPSRSTSASPGSWPRSARSTALPTDVATIRRRDVDPHLRERWTPGTAVTRYQDLTLESTAEEPKHETHGGADRIHEESV